MGPEVGVWVVSAPLKLVGGPALTVSCLSLRPPSVCHIRLSPCRPSVGHVRGRPVERCMSAMQAGTQMVKLRGSSKGLVRFYFLDEHRSCIRWRPSRKNEKAKSERGRWGEGRGVGAAAGSWEGSKVRGSASLQGALGLAHGSSGLGALRGPWMPGREGSEPSALQGPGLVPAWQSPRGLWGPAALSWVGSGMG